MVIHRPPTGYSLLASREFHPIFRISRELLQPSRGKREEKEGEISSRNPLLPTTKWNLDQDRSLRGLVAVIKQEIAIAWKQRRRRRRRRGRDYAVRCLRSLCSMQKMDQQWWISRRVTATTPELPFPTRGTITLPILTIFVLRDPTEERCKKPDCCAQVRYAYLRFPPLPAF